MTKAQNILNDVMDKYLVMTETGRDRENLPGGPRGKRRPGESRGAGSFGYRGYDDGDRWGR